MKPQMWTLAVLVIATVALAAQQESPAPNPLGQPLVDSAGKVRDEAILRTPLLPEDRKYADLDGQRMKQFVMEVDAISLKDRDSGNLFWGRNVGTAGHVATQDWVEAYFRKHGLQNVHRMPFDLQPQWTPKSWDIDVCERRQDIQAAVRPAGRPRCVHARRRPRVGHRLGRRRRRRRLHRPRRQGQGGARPRHPAARRHPALGRPRRRQLRAPSRRAPPRSASSSASPTTSPSGRRPADAPDSISATRTGRSSAS